MLTDTHAHLDYPEFEPDLPDIINRAKEAGVTRILSIGTSLASSRRAVALAERFPCIHAVIGVHPTSVMEAEKDVIHQLRELAKSPRVVALGEIGIDHYRLPRSGEEGPSTKDAGNVVPTSGDPSIPDVAVFKSTQATLFQAQLELATELGLNVVIHQRAAWDETLEILKPFTGKLRAVYHCFGDRLEQANVLFKRNHMISFTGIITFKNATITQDTAKRAPIDAVMVETDCPYLAPVPFRGKRCEPAYTRLVAEQLAQLRGVPLEEIADQTTRNADTFFRFQNS